MTFWQRLELFTGTAEWKLRIEFWSGLARGFGWSVGLLTAGLVGWAIISLVKLSA